MLLQKWLDELDIPYVSTRDEPALFTADPVLFLQGDEVHPSERGHEHLARALQAICDRLLTFEPGDGPKTGKSDTPAMSSPPMR